MSHSRWRARSFIPGDSLTRPGGRVPTLLLPIAAPWLKISDAIDLAREVRPQTVVAIHDAMLNERGLGLVDRLLGSPLLAAGGSAPTYHRLAIGQSIDL